MNKNKILSLVAILFGFKTGAEAPAQLNEEQRKKLEEEYGKKAADAYDEFIKPDASTEAVADMRTALEEHFAELAGQSITELQAQLNTANADLEKQHKLVAVLSASPEDDLTPEGTTKCLADVNPLKIFVMISRLLFPCERNVPNSCVRSL